MFSRSSSGKQRRSALQCGPNYIFQLVESRFGSSLLGRFLPVQCQSKFPNRTAPGSFPMLGALDQA
jgi:hypothetical protein